MGRLSAADLRPHSPGEWTATRSGMEVEVLVGGTGQGPDPSCLEELNAALDDLPAIERRALELLETFIDRRRVSGGGDESWFLESARVEAREAAPVLTLCFALAGDTYGSWSVRFQNAGAAGRFFPVFFSRQTI
jgi:hypothetical protein